MTSEQATTRTTSDLMKKCQSRAALSNHAHKLVKTIESKCSEFASTVPAEVRALRALKRNLEAQISKIESVNNEILDMVDSVTVETEMTKFLEEADAFYYALSYAEECLNIECITSTTTKPVVAHVNSSDVVRVKMPIIELPKFDGNPKNWLSFWDQFESSVHSKKISEIDKFTYLKSTLIGPAKDCIAGLTHTKANYDHAIKLLTERFGNENVLKSNQIKSNQIKYI